MVLSTIYVVRHGFRSNWVVDAETGEYSTTIRSPTGIASDPALASYGVAQAKELGTHLASIDPPIDAVYSSPFYRCIQTLSPFTETRVAKAKAANADEEVVVSLEPGLGEFYGLARFDHPSPATIEVLKTHFPHLHAEKNAIVVPSTKGESIPQLHDRIAYCLTRLIERLDADPKGPKSLLICTHAASMICIGRALTGVMPEDDGEEDFRCFTCAFSKFTRKTDRPTEKKGEDWEAEKADEIPDVGWRGGKGVAGGWTCEVNGDCSFLSNGEERGWKFSGDESFLKDPNAFNDAKNTDAIEVVEESTEGVQRARNGSGSRL